MKKIETGRKAGWLKTGFLLAMLAFGMAVPQAHADIPKVIFDSDMSSDWDDVGDIAVLHGLASMGECEIIGMAVSSTNGATAMCMDAINTYYGKPDIPIGVRPDVAGNGGYPAQIANEFAHGPETSSVQFPLAVNLYRQLLAASPDNSVIIITAGYMNNIQALLQSGPDSYSALAGPALVSQKVKLLACIGGQYPSGDEFNFKVEPTSAAYVVNNWPAAVTYTGFEMGNQIRTAGRIAETPANNPIRRVYVDIENNYPYPSWTQIGELQAIRGSAGSYFGAVTVGRNNADSTAHNFWTATPDPTGNQEQGYLLEKVRYPVIEELNALMNLAPNNGAASKPGWPSNVKAAVVGGNTINLTWTDNSFNEAGFKIERRTNGVYSEIATVGANVTSYSDTSPSTITNASYRVKSYNATGESSPTYVWVYSGWTEINFAGSGTSPSLYSYYQHNLHWNRGGDFRPDHVALNNDSTHGQTLTVDIDVSATGQQGNFYVYFFYQDQNNWYRLNVGESTCKFEKKVAGTITTIGASASTTNIGTGTGPNHWKIQVTPAGNLRYTRTMPFSSEDEKQYHLLGTLLDVTDTMSFTSGKIGLGGNARTPIWENFTFSTLDIGPVPAAPAGLAATTGNGQVGLSWTASSGTVTYDVYRGTTAGGESTTAVATGLTTISFTNTGLTNGTTYYYTVKAVNESGSSTASNEASATPATGSAPAAPTGLGAAAGDTLVILNWTASSGATSYNVYRGTTAGGESTTAIATGLTTASYTNTGLTNGTAYYYKVAAVNTAGTSSLSSEASAIPSAGGGGATVFTNASFEAPSIGGYSYAPSGSGWTFTNNGGIQHNNSAYSGSSTIAPGGTQTALLQGVSSTLGTMSQTVNFATAGSYTISFQAARRYSAAQPVRISVDGTTVGTYTPSTNNFEQMTTASFTVTAGTHVVMFAATDSSGDKTTFIDLVSISGGGSAPAAPAGLGAASGNMQAILSWTASSGATSYNVYRGTTAGGESPTAIATGITATGYTNTGLANGTMYYYKVRAVNAIGTSGDSNEASVLVNQSYSFWAGENNLVGNAALPTADPNSNGITNLVEYALGMDPTSGSLTGLPTSFVDGTNLSISYNQLRVDVTYQPEWSTDLATWHTENISVSNMGTVKTATIPLGTDTRKFIHLRIVQ